MIPNKHSVQALWTLWYSIFTQNSMNITVPCWDWRRLGPSCWQMGWGFWADSISQLRIISKLDLAYRIEPKGNLGLKWATGKILLGTTPFGVIGGALICDCSSKRFPFEMCELRHWIKGMPPKCSGKSQTEGHALRDRNEYRPSTFSWNIYLPSLWSLLCVYTLQDISFSILSFFLKKKK